MGLPLKSAGLWIPGLLLGDEVREQRKRRQDDEIEQSTSLQVQEVSPRGAEIDQIDIDFGQAQEMEDGVHVFEAKYEELELLGNGQFGEVRKVRHLRAGTLHAVKRLRRAPGSSEDSMELSLLPQMSHKNVVGFLEHFVSDTELLLVMEFCDGGTLKGVAHSSDECASIMHGLLSAVEHCHSLGYSHGDLKLDNIMFAAPPNQKSSEPPVLKLIDFGNARHMGTDADQSRQALAQDMWFVGLVFFQLITGQNFFALAMMESESLEDQGVDVDPDRMTCCSEYVRMQMATARRFGDKMALDLLGKLLKLDGMSRITAKEALEHPFVHALSHEPPMHVTRTPSFSSRSTTVGSCDEFEPCRHVGSSVSEVMSVVTTDS